MAKKKSNVKSISHKKKTRRKSKPRKSTKRAKKKSVPGLNKYKFSKIKQEFHDIDYADKLDKFAADWLSRFMWEELGANLNHDGKKINKKKADKRRCYNANNRRNRDMYGVARATGTLDSYEPSDEGYNPEDDLIDLLDSQKISDDLEDT